VNSSVSPGKVAWFVVALLVPVALLNYLDRQMLATMKASMVADIPTIANRADWGLVLGFFKWTYAILSPFGGYVADRIGRHRVISASLLIWSAVTWWTGHTTTFHELVVTRALMGISEAFYMPASLAFIADYHPGLTRSRAIGASNRNLRGPDSGRFCRLRRGFTEHGWRWAFTTCGLIRMIYAMPLMALLSVLVVLVIRPQGDDKPTA
jgi:MFS family permease